MFSVWVSVSIWDHWNDQTANDCTAQGNTLTDIHSITRIMGRCAVICHVQPCACFEFFVIGTPIVLYIQSLNVSRVAEHVTGRMDRLNFKRSILPVTCSAIGMMRKGTTFLRKVSMAFPRGYTTKNDDWVLRRPGRIMPLLERYRPSLLPLNRS